ncbi:MAG: hypothetical protein ACR2O3_01285 [Rhizobiaceae bacterium]
MGKAKTVAGLMMAQFNALAQQRKGLLPFHVYLPNSQHIMGSMLAEMLATLGQRSVSLTLTCQYLDQLGKYQSAAFGNIGSWAIFRVGLTDALELEKLFEWDNTRKYLYELGYLETRILTPITTPKLYLTLINNLNPRNYTKAIVKHSRHYYCRSRGEIETEISSCWGSDNEN